MTEKQRVHLEELTLDFEQVVLLTTEHRDREYTRRERDKALKDITDYLTVIQNNCISLGCYSNE